MKIYPNPSKSTTYISVPEDLVSGCSLTVTNNSGDLVFSQEYAGISNMVIPLDLKNQPSGLYRITLGNEYQEVSNELLLLSGS